MPDKIKNVGVLGAGTMGLGIAQVCAMSGFKVQLFDVHEGTSQLALLQIRENLQKGVDRGKVIQDVMQKTLANVVIADRLSDLISDLVIEAVVEKLEVKHQLFSELDLSLPKDTVFCTNTSSIPVTKIAAGLQHRHRFVGMHFFNPAHIMKLVEVVAGEDTDPAVVERAVDFVRFIGKTPVVAQDSPGFIVNRVARHFYVESLRILEDGVASFEDIDKLVEATGFNMGPFKLMDLIGVDTNFAVTSTMYNGFHQDPKFRPSRIQEHKIMAGHLGRKSGRGFYTYD